jgi:hypothetical protein
VPYPDILGSICHIHHIYISNTSLYWKESGWGGGGGGGIGQYTLLWERPAGKLHRKYTKISGCDGSRGSRTKKILTKKRTGVEIIWPSLKSSV